MKKITLLLLGLLATICLQANELKFTEITTQEQWESALKDAKKQDKLLFVDIYTDWCGYCKKLDRDVYTNESVISYHEGNFINIKINAEVGYGVTFAREQKVTGYPTLLYMNASAKIVTKIPGYIDANTLNSEAKKAIDVYQKLPLLIKEFDAGKADEAKKLALLPMLKQTGKLAKMNEVANDYFGGISAENYGDLKVLEFAQEYGADLESDIYTKLMAEKTRIEPSNLEAYTASVFRATMLRAVQEKNYALVEKVIEQLLA